MKKNEDLAELTGFILGDGNITKADKTREVAVTLNNDEEQIQERVVELFKRIYEGKIKIQERPDYGANVVKTYGWDSVSKTIEYVMPEGDKIENQVSVPNWIFEDEKYVKRCLKGLIDSDGSVYIQQQDGRKYTMINFKNKSKRLLKDFELMCKKLGINTSNSSNAKAIYAQSSVEKFLEEVKPIKSA